MDYTEFMNRNKLNYEIVKLKHEGKTFQEIGDQYNLSGTGIAYKYRHFLFKLFRCYCQFLNRNSIRDAYDFLEFYVDTAVTIAYLEQVHDDLLSVLRHGEPPLLAGFYTDIPPYRHLAEEQVKSLEKQIIEAKDRKNKTYADIGSTLNLTTEKVKRIYQSYYHQKCLKAIEVIEPEVNFSFSEYIFSYSHYPQVRWQQIVREYAELIQDLID